jgi:hypothetical protein
MKKKIIGMFVCMILIATAVPAVTSLKNSAINPVIPSHPLTSMAGYWTEMQTLLASDGAPNDYFGDFVSISGDTALIGAPKDDMASVPGSAYVFTRTGTTWTQQAKLVASDGAAGDYFGYSVSLSGDTALIGAFGNNNEKGAAYVFTRTGTIWTQQAKLYDWNPTGYDFFGLSVSLYDANNALIGEPGHTVNGQFNAGAAYAFFRSGSTWNYDILYASDAAADDQFGWSVSLFADTALIGAFGDDNLKGAAYVFTHTGTFWTQQTKLFALDGAALDIFGWSVSLEGDNALIGASNKKVYGVEYAGAVYVYHRTGTTWNYNTIWASDGLYMDGFGISVSLSGDTALIGAYGYSSYKGAAYVFRLIGTTWTQQQKLIVTGASYDRFGGSVSLDGDTALIGANGHDSNKGAAYVFINEEQSPYPPTITGPASGKAGEAHSYTFNTTDPNGDEVSYYIDWGDNSNSGWLGPNPSGHEITQSHTWSKGTYIIKAKAKDSYGSESAWATLSVTMPYSYNIPSLPFWEKLFERFPHAFPILRHLMGY